MYWKAVTVIEAQDALTQMQIADYPHMKKDARAKIHRHFHRLAYPKNAENCEQLTTDQIAERLKAALK